MSRNDNSLEQQLLDFYGEKILDEIHFKYQDDIRTSDELSIVYLSIYLDLIMKKYGVSKQFLEREKNKLQIELYSQLERDRNNEKNI